MAASASFRAMKEIMRRAFLGFTASAALVMARPVLMMQVPQGGQHRCKMMQGINSAVGEAYHLPEFVIIMHGNPPDVGSLDGRLFSDNQGRVDALKKAYGV